VPLGEVLRSSVEVLQVVLDSLCTGFSVANRVQAATAARRLALAAGGG
jgi:hypothetical protein